MEAVQRLPKNQRLDGETEVFFGPVTKEEKLARAVIDISEGVRCKEDIRKLARSSLVHLSFGKPVTEKDIDLLRKKLRRSLSTHYTPSLSINPSSHHQRREKEEEEEEDGSTDSDASDDGQADTRNLQLEPACNFIQFQDEEDELVTFSKKLKLDISCDSSTTDPSLTRRIIAVSSLLQNTDDNLFLDQSTDTADVSVDHSALLMLQEARESLKTIHNDDNDNETEDETAECSINDTTRTEPALTEMTTTLVTKKIHGQREIGSLVSAVDCNTGRFFVDDDLSIVFRPKKAQISTAVPPLLPSPDLEADWIVPTNEALQTAHHLCSESISSLFSRQSEFDSWICQRPLLEQPELSLSTRFDRTDIKPLSGLQLLSHTEELMRIVAEIETVNNTFALESEKIQMLMEVGGISSVSQSDFLGTDPLAHLSAILNDLSEATLPVKKRKSVKWRSELSTTQQFAIATS